MSGKKISGKDVDFMMGSLLVTMMSVSISIEDNSTAVYSRGVPNGHVSGDKKASGEAEVDSDNLQLIMDAAKSAGSFSALEPFDTLFNASGTDVELKIEAFGCKFRISDLLNAQANGGDKLSHKLPFDVTSPDFVNINGVPYIDASETENLI